MASTFARTTRSLAADGHGRSVLVLALASVLLLLWGAWFFLARVAVNATTGSARLEVDTSVHAIDARVSGRVVSTHLELGREVEVGEVLVELDGARVELALEQARNDLGSLERQLEALRREMETEEELLGERRQAASVAVAEAQARSREALAEARYAQEKAERWGDLRSGGVVSGIEGLEARADAERSAATVEASRAAVSRRRHELTVDQTEQHALIARLGREAVRMEGEIGATRATITRLEHELELHRIRAPVSGTVGEVADLQVGAVVAEGDRLGAVVPGGEVLAVALFTPAEAAGRIRAGQPARLRLEGFPWTQYGSLAATVRSVASEPHAGRIRVELEIGRGQRTAIPLQHGLPGSAEVEVERITPAEMVVRAAGRLVTARPDDPPAEPTPEVG